MSDQKVLRAKTAALTRMLNMQGVIGMFGHVSIRMPGTDICFISPGASTEKSTVRPEQISSTTLTAPSSSIPAA